MLVRLQPEDQRYVESQLKSGRYTSAQDVVHEAIGAVRSVRQMIDQRLLDAIASGPAEPLPTDWKQQIRQQLDAVEERFEA